MIKKTIRSFQCYLAEKIAQTVGQRFFANPEFEFKKIKNLYGDNGTWATLTFVSAIYCVPDKSDAEYTTNKGAVFTGKTLVSISIVKEGNDFFIKRSSNCQYKVTDAEFIEVLCWLTGAVYSSIGSCFSANIGNKENVSLSRNGDFDCALESELKKLFGTNTLSLEHPRCITALSFKLTDVFHIWYVKHSLTQGLERLSAAVFTDQDGALRIESQDKSYLAESPRLRLILSTVTFILVTSTL